MKKLSVFGLKCYAVKRTKAQADSIGHILRMFGSPLISMNLKHARATENKFKKTKKLAQKSPENKEKFYWF